MDDILCNYTLICFIFSHWFNSFSSQYFADVKEAQDKIKKMQESIKKKYSCDRTTTTTRLEDLLLDAAVSTKYLPSRSG